MRIHPYLLNGDLKTEILQARKSSSDFNSSRAWKFHVQSKTTSTTIFIEQSNFLHHVSYDIT